MFLAVFFFKEQKNIENWVHGFLPNCARPQKMGKKTRETSSAPTELARACLAPRLLY
jgi:hypothetical protein